MLAVPYPRRVKVMSAIADGLTRRTLDIRCISCQDFGSSRKNPSGASATARDIGCLRSRPRREREPSCPRSPCTPCSNPVTSPTTTPSTAPSPPSSPRPSSTTGSRTRASGAPGSTCSTSSMSTTTTRCGPDCATCRSTSPGRSRSPRCSRWPTTIPATTTDCRSSGASTTRSGAGDKHRAVGPFHQPCPDRAEHHPLEAMPAWSHHDQLGLLGALEKHLVRAAAHDLALRRNSGILRAPRAELAVEIGAEDLLGGGSGRPGRPPAVALHRERHQCGTAQRRLLKGVADDRLGGGTLVDTDDHRSVTHVRPPPHHYDRALRVAGHLTADRPERLAGDAALAARADDQEGRLLGSVQQHRHRVARQRHGPDL